MKAIVISEREFDLAVDKLKADLSAALDRDQKEGVGQLIRGFSKIVTYYVETFRRDTKNG